MNTTEESHRGMVVVVKVATEMLVTMVLVTNHARGTCLRDRGPSLHLVSYYDVARLQKAITIPTSRDKK